MPSEVVMDNTKFQKSRISTIKRKLSVKGCPLTEFQKPFRKILVDNNERFKNTSCIFSSSLVFGFFVQNCVTISCQDGSSSTMYCDSIFKELLNREVRQVVISWPVLLSCIIGTTEGYWVQ